MTISKDKVVSIDYTLKDDKGAVIDTSANSGPLEYLHGNGRLITGMEKALEGKQPGDEFQITISPEEGYGVFNPDLIIKVPREQFDTDITIEPGMCFQASDGSIVTVKEVTDKEVTIDANHELAGKTLFFDVKVVSVRDATPEELAPPSSGCGGGCGGCGGSCGSCGGGCGGC